MKNEKKISKNPLAIGEFEELVLLAIQNLGNHAAYGVPIREVLEEKTGRRVTVGALYATLSRLEEKGFVTSREVNPEPGRGGRPRVYFKIEALGESALQQAERARTNLRVLQPGLVGGLA